MSTATLEIEVQHWGEPLATKYGHITVEIAIVTPSVAEDLLKRNVRNRPLNKRHYESIGETMTCGDYVLNGETIIIGSDNNVLDGQHRLHGCIYSGKPFVTLIVRGIDPEAFDTIDAGRARKTGEVLAIEGEANSNAVAGAVSQFVQFVDCGGRMQSGTAGHRRKATPRLSARILEQHPGIRDSVSAMRRCPLYRNQQAYVLHYLFSCVSQRLADDFAAVLSVGSTEAWRPFNVLRESMIRTPVNPATRRSFAAKCVKAFNAERAGDKPKMFRFNDTEEFPTIDALDYEWLACTVD